MKKAKIKAAVAAEKEGPLASIDKKDLFEIGLWLLRSGHPAAVMYAATASKHFNKGLAMKYKGHSPLDVAHRCQPQWDAVLYKIEDARVLALPIQVCPSWRVWPIEAVEELHLVPRVIRRWAAQKGMTQMREASTTAEGTVTFTSSTTFAQLLFSIRQRRAQYICADPLDDSPFGALHHLAEERQWLDPDCTMRIKTNIADVDEFPKPNRLIVTFRSSHEERELILYAPNEWGTPKRRPACIERQSRKWSESTPYLKETFCGCHKARHSFNDKPAYENTVTGEKHWFKHGKRHRKLPDPAIIYPSGETEHWVFGCKYVENADGTGVYDITQRAPPDPAFQYDKRVERQATFRTRIEEASKLPIIDLTAA